MARHHNRAFFQTGAISGSRWQWRIEETSMLATLSVCSILTLGIYLSTVWAGARGGASLWPFTEAPAPSVQAPIPAFQLSGIQLGMTPLEAASVQDELRFSRNRKGGQTGRLQLGNGAYTISFSTPAAGKQAYRIHYAETFWSISDVEIRQRLKRKFGAPVVNQCSRESFDNSLVCELKWQRLDGVTIDAMTQSARVARGLSKTRLELTALDPLLERRNILRAKTPEKSGQGSRYISENRLKRGTAFANRLKAISSAARNR